MAKLVVGLFDALNDAQSALQDLRQAGFGDNITFVQGHESGLQERLVSAGIPQQDATIYADGVHSGGGLLLLQALSNRQASQAADILDRYNVVDITNRAAGYNHELTTRDKHRTGMSNLYKGGETKIPIIEEELRIGKREVEQGGVRVNTRVEEVPVNEQVTLREETVDVHRKPVDRPVSEADLANLQQGSFEVRERAEEAVVDKLARVVEEVHVKKNVQERTENIQDTVRRTDVDVDQLGTQERSVGYTGSGTTSTSSDEGFIERGASKLGNAAERATGSDLDNDGDVGRRDPRNNY
ncbi:MAG: YsnF/AvaK domain-containing protein [Chloroflexi bacterium]|nr:YsnF/AvaK domain-containing protein [Chloroflexota bacterium]